MRFFRRRSLATHANERNNTRTGKRPAEADEHDESYDTIGSRLEPDDQFDIYVRRKRSDSSTVSSITYHDGRLYKHGHIQRDYGAYRSSDRSFMSASTWFSSLFCCWSGGPGMDSDNTMILSHEDDPRSQLSIPGDVARGQGRTNGVFCQSWKREANNDGLMMSCTRVSEKSNPIKLPKTQAEQYQTHLIGRTPPGATNKEVASLFDELSDDGREGNEENMPRSGSASRRKWPRGPQTLLRKLSWKRKSNNTQVSSGRQSSTLTRQDRNKGANVAVVHSNQTEVLPYPE